MMKKALPYRSDSLPATCLLLLGTELSADSYELVPVKPYPLNTDSANQAEITLMVMLGDAILSRDVFLNILLVFNQLRAE
ncbi:MAG: hypothetical protein KZQ93_05625 [Candidatus Thiodiazotropha sp. (ex Monitilora ramsayi)]|nr:hypothetical protein [Candidatus Thiodiazotropha sp. (ex Monitilora ramsayi)]